MRKVFAGGDASLYESFSAELHVDEEFPATYLFHEEKDPTIPCKGLELLSEALAFFDVDYQFDLFHDEVTENTPLHGFGVTSELSEASQWMNHALSFLKERGF